MLPSNSAVESSHRLGEIVINEELVGGLLNEFRQIVESAIANETKKLCEAIPTHEANQKVDPAQQPPASDTGVEVAHAGKLRAVDLRTAFLLGKLPEDAGILIDI